MPIPGDPSVRQYMSLPLFPEEFEKVWPLRVKDLEKTRYYINDMDADVRIDVFEGDLKGLVLAEVVFPDENGVRSFEKPDWFGPDVTREDWASNQFVAGKKFGEIKEYISKITAAN